MYFVYDIGGTFIKFALMENNGTIKMKDKFPTTAKSAEELVEQMVEKWRPYQQDVTGIAVSCPGVVNTETGVIYQGGALLFMHEKNLAEMLARECHVPVVLQNDAKSAALAELWLGVAEDVDSAAILTLGSGVGGGIIMNGKLQSGFNLMAGEVSFIQTSFDTEKLRGKFFGRTGSAVELIKRIATKKNLADKKDGEQVFEWINQGDEEAQAIFDDYIYGLASQVLNIQYLIDPEIIAIGGGISAQPIVVKRLNKAIEEIKAANPFHGARPKIVTCHFQNDANLYGALYNFFLQSIG
ncbi:ROK family protein [Listeria cossartiae subsp. cayugensis]|uniref:ROK family protein n=1 Tax=Listeria cossartiae TaxID=2838249 RepID=UPI0028804D3E|nr:ROK family protein [Listeria cossartiae]MDT0000707.1 ROK family protein [Listeria cossartiae subsp. cayugensis]MDT0009189.1 ROK family protein [Listeria cossartiae subsp. cayugensis]MDT0031021.1 ROK family protein [Listeria cossartiae subsp. cayugensis]MDT0039136.1 ROK family protein [Listeria cossartiae subsp. cayugensis]MDT0044204.1 ROK family protein [Listeria cossartiae subsp. cayugensis]